MRFDFSRKEYEFFIAECGFTDFEIKVLDLKRKCWCNLTVAEELYVSESTIKRHVSSIKRKIIKAM